MSVIEDTVPEPRKLTVWSIRYGLDVLDEGDRGMYGPDTATVLSTDSLDDALQVIRDVWVGKTLRSRGCSDEDCNCGGKEHRAKVMGVKFIGAKMVTQLTDLERDVERATSLVTEEVE